MGKRAALRAYWPSLSLVSGDKLLKDGFAAIEKIFSHLFRATALAIVGCINNKRFNRNDNIEPTLRSRKRNCDTSFAQTARDGLIGRRYSKDDKESSSIRGRASKDGAFSGCVAINVVGACRDE